MKPPVFDYHAPETLDQALELLSQYGDEAKVLAGGQSLVPAMNFRLARPTVLIDLRCIPGLEDLDDQGDHVRIGAMCRQRAVEHSPLVAHKLPLVHRTLPYVAHPQIRNRGTFGGSLAHADPSAELPAVMLALDGRYLAKSHAGERWVEGDCFNTGLFETALRPDEILTVAELPAAAAGEGFGFQEMARRHGDYALCGVAVKLSSQDGILSGVKVALLSVADGPICARSPDAALTGARIENLAGSAELRQACETVRDDIDPPSDLHAGAEFRKHLAVHLTRRAIEQALSDLVDA